MTTQYAKFAKIQVNSPGRGMQTSLTLPSSYTIGSSGGYIHFYVGLGDYECGISTDYGTSGWRWFASSGAVTGTDAGGTVGEFAQRDTVNIKLTLDDTDNKAKFYVNGALKHTFSPSYTSSTAFDNCRLILGALTTTFSTVPDPLPAWQVFHDQVTASGLMYKNANRAWLNIKAANATPTVFHTPGSKTPNPQNYSFDSSQLSSSRVYGSIQSY
ncbi:hypothetical protein B5M42_003615 [Paenibacillus athensensis]|uniref:Uncharacterized protein n=1 Tax=Paenibacillus athensensis TaxID=1967502 RepID=A0A4Y8PUL1_9BACL|nr:hypothetical protein [Paenibacillus athensensis]MCD1257929.1 hypothetical protein [Paenibacillus athensensis]